MTQTRHLVRTKQHHCAACTGQSRPNITAHRLLRSCLRSMRLLFNIINIYSISYNFEIRYDMIYTGAHRRAFQLPKACTRRLWLPLYGPCVISEHVEMRLQATTPALAYSYREVCGFFLSPPIERRDTRPTA